MPITLTWTDAAAAVVRSALRSVETDAAESYDAAHRRGDRKMVAHYNAKLAVLHAVGAELDTLLDPPTPSPVLAALAASAAAMTGWREDGDVPQPVTVSDLTPVQRMRAATDWPEAV